MINRGSEWRKWDLHIHSPLTHGTANKYAETTVQEFCEDIIKNEVAVIGLTNYFYMTESEYLEVQEGLRDKCLVIPNFEFRASDKNNKGDHINFHVLFNPSIDIKRILNCIGRVKLHNYTDKYCNEEDVNAIGLEAASIDFEILLKQLNTDFKEIDDFIIACPYTGYGGFKNDDKPRNSSIVKKFDEKSHFIFGNGGLKEFFHCEREYDRNGTPEIVQKIMATVFCSDAHSKVQINQNTTWIKADSTFEGLKQIIFEPIQRVKIQKEKPDEKSLSSVIKMVKFGGSDSQFSTEPIYFNDNLNVIIGGKSSGKSILLYNIARTLIPERNDYSILKTKNPDNGKFEYKYSFKGDDQFEVTLNSNSTQIMGRGDEDSSILPDIKYIPQNYLSELAEKKYRKGNELNKLVRDLLIEDNEYSTMYNGVIQKLRSNDYQREVLINKFVDLKGTTNGLSAEVSRMGNVDAIQANIGLIINSIEQLKSEAGFTPEQMELYDTYNVQLQELEIVEAKIINDRSRIESFNNSAIVSLEEVVQRKDHLINNIETESLKNHFTEIYKRIDEVISYLLVEQNKNYNVEGEVPHQENVFDKELLLCKSKISDLKLKLKPFLEGVESKKKIKEFEEALMVEIKKLEAIKAKKVEIEKSKVTLREEYAKIFLHYENNYSEYLALIEKFQQRIGSLQDENLVINGIVKFNARKFKDSMLRISNGTVRSYRDSALMDENFTSQSLYTIKQIVEEKKELFSLISKGEYSLVKGNDEKNAFKVLLDDYFFDFWEVSSGRDTLYQMSAGKASFVILKLIIGLSKSKAPILIDQPEDNLDNRSITKDLVSYLKVKKNERQIILVTHNPNIVVNADAENVIVANQRTLHDEEKDNPFQFEYVNGALENSFENGEEPNILRSMGIREHIADIVEGGKEAFKSREVKYRFS